MRSVFFLFTLLACFSFANAQNTSPEQILKKYNDETLHFNRGYISKGENGPRLRGPELRKEFDTSPLTQDVYTMSRHSQTTALVLLGVSLGCLITSRSIYNSNRNLSNVFLGGFLVSHLTSLSFTINAAKKRNYAIWLRNRDVLTR